MVCQCWIDEGFLAVERFRRTATWETIAIAVRINDFREQLGNCTQPEPSTTVSPIQGLSEHKLPAVRVIAEVHPVIYFTPILRTFCDGRPRASRVYAADHNIHSVKPAFRVESIGNPLPIQAPEHVQPVRQDHRFMKTSFSLTEGLPHAICGRDNVWIQKSDVKAFRVSVCQKRLMQVRQSGGDGAPISTASNHQNPHAMFQQFGMNLVGFHSFIPHHF